MNDIQGPLSIEQIVRRFVDRGIVAQSRDPEIVILMGPPATGKTSIRRANYSQGYVIVDPPELFLRFCGGTIMDFPGDYDEPLKIIGFLIANTAILERRDMVTEIIGDSKESTFELIDAMTDAGYHVRLEHIHCDLQESWRRNVSRGVNNISSYYAQPYNIRWLTLAAQNYKGIQENV